MLFEFQSLRDSLPLNLKDAAYNTSAKSRGSLPLCLRL